VTADELLSNNDIGNYIYFKVSVLLILEALDENKLVYGQH